MAATPGAYAAPRGPPVSLPPVRGPAPMPRRGRRGAPYPPRRRGHGGRGPGGGPGGVWIAAGPGAPAEPT
eukprot:10444674-Alexandrium_andersonii.AAC.1